jgi:ectoine hydroxylase-related dioxygenase (phytanoyl-CoA dioxygenase family)
MFKYNLKDNGVCFLPKIFNSTEIARCIKALDFVISGKYRSGHPPEARFWNVGDDPASIIKIDKPHLCDKTIWNFITKNSFGSALAKATNSKKIKIWHSQLVWKPKSKGQSGNAGWHRDSQYWPFWSKKGLFTAWIALTKVTKKSGPVKFVINSHNWESLSGLDFFNKNLKKQNKIIKDRCASEKIILGTLDKGEVSIHSSLTYHSSGKNVEEEPRIGLVVHFCNEEAKQIKTDKKYTRSLRFLANKGVSPVIYEK